MRFKSLLALLAGVAVALPGLAMAQTALPAPTEQPETFGEAVELIDPNNFRVCADPASLPFSNDKLEGFENKIADLLAAKLGKTVTYTWFPMATGFVRKTLGERRCDVIIGYAQGDELVQNTNAYYRTAYSLVVPAGSDLADVESLDDPRLKGRAIGLVAGTPPASIMAVNGLMGKVRPYQLMVDMRYTPVPQTIMEDLSKGVIEAAVLWGPIAGYYAKQAEPDHVVIPLVKETKGPRMAYRITMGVRASDQNWKRELNRLIRDNQDEINQILLEYGVPLLDEKDRPITN